MSLYEWLLVLHVMSAFILVAGVVVGGVAVFAGGPTGRVLALPAAALPPLGGILVLIFYSVWLGIILIILGLLFGGFRRGRWY